MIPLPVRSGIFLFYRGAYFLINSGMVFWLNNPADSADSIIRFHWFHRFICLRAVNSPPEGGSLKQYCLLMAFAASFKTVAFSQNSLRPFEIQKNYSIINFSNQGGARAKPETPALYANWRIRGAKLSLFGGAIKAYFRPEKCLTLVPNIHRGAGAIRKWRELQPVF